MLRELGQVDMHRACIPERYWNVMLKNIPDSVPYKQAAKAYMRDLEKFIKDGVGLFLWSKDNSTGKTALGILCLMQTMRLGKTAMFIPSFDLTAYSVDKNMFDEGQTMFERARKVDVLLIDDADKEYKTSSGWAENMVENMIRYRVQKNKVVIVTSNLPPSDIKNVYSKALSELCQYNQL